MPSTRSLDVAAELSSSAVELRVRAQAGQLAVVRAVAAAIAGQQDFDLDEIADVRLAIDEACSHLIVRAQPNAVLECVFEHGDDALHITVRTSTTSSDAAGKRSFGWHVLNTLADAVELTQEPDPDRPGGFVAAIDFVKHKMAVPSGE